MCCFTGPVINVKGTRIFARAMDGGNQLVAYDTAFAAAADLAMVLPIPVREGSGENAVRFVDVSWHADMFTQLDAAFAPPSFEAGFGAPQAGAAYRAPPPLVVHQVGVFEASYVPTRRDFARLDPRFRLDDRVTDALGARASYGFVVVKLGRTTDLKRVHPVAFVFPSREPDRIFFPTVHVHDGAVHDSADFDHALYTTDAERAFAFSHYDASGGAAIPSAEPTSDEYPMWWRHKEWLAAHGVPEIRGADGVRLLGSHERVYRCELAGRRRNDDTWIERGAAPTPADIVGALDLAVREGRAPTSLVDALRPVFYERTGLFTRLREVFAQWSIPTLKVMRVDSPEASIASGSVFRVHARGAWLAGPSDMWRTRSVLCGLAPEMPNQPIHALYNEASIEAWSHGGARPTAAQVAWLNQVAQ